MPRCCDIICVCEAVILPHLHYEDTQTKWRGRRRLTPINAHPRIQRSYSKLSLWRQTNWSSRYRNSLPSLHVGSSEYPSGRSKTAQPWMARQELHHPRSGSREAYFLVRTMLVFLSTFEARRTSRFREKARAQSMAETGSELWFPYIHGYAIQLSTILMPCGIQRDWHIHVGRWRRTKDNQQNQTTLSRTYSSLHGSKKTEEQWSAILSNTHASTLISTFCPVLSIDHRDQSP